MENLARPLRRFGYRLTDQAPSGATFSRHFRTWPIRLLAVLLFPIGLVFLVFKREETITMSFEPAAVGTKVVIAGEGPRKVRRQFAQLAGEPSQGAALGVQG